MILQLPADVGVPALLALLSALAAGFISAAILRMAFPTVKALTWSTSILLAVVGGAVGSTVAHLIWPERIPFSVLMALGATWVLMFVGSAIKSRISPQVSVHGTPAEELLRLGESEWVEFKSTARRNLHTGERDPAIEAVIAKTACGFLNGRGGTLLIGVDDEGEILGLSDDLDFLKRPDLDSYELFLTDLFASSLGVPATADIEVTFWAPGQGVGTTLDPPDALCRVDVNPAPVPVYLTPVKGRKEPEFWVRSGNGTRRLRVDEVLDYYRRRWGGPMGGWRKRG